MQSQLEPDYDILVELARLQTLCMHLTSHRPLRHRAAEGAELQDTLSSITGRSTVPQVFIGGQFLGGCDGACQTHWLAPTQLTLVLFQSSSHWLCWRLVTSFSCTFSSTANNSHTVC